MHLINEVDMQNPVEAIMSLKEKVYDHERFTMEEYLEHLAQSVWKFNHLGLHIEGNSLEEKCESALSQLINFGLVSVH